MGQASAMVSALVLLSSFAQLNLSNTLPRFLPQVGRRAGRLIGLGYALSAGCGLLVGLAFVLVMPAVSPQWQFLGGSELLRILFVAAAVVWGIFALQDAALLGLSRPIMVPVENAVYGAAKVAVLIGIATALPVSGIFVSWTIPLALTVPAVNWLIFRRYLAAWPIATAVATVHPRSIVRFTAVDYVGAVASQGYGSLLPLIVLSTLGAAANGSFYIAWTIATGLELVATNFATSLLVEGSAAPGRLGELTRGIVARSLLVIVSGAVALTLGAHLILSIYGHGYAAAATHVLTLLAAGMILYGLLLIVFSLDRLGNRVGRATATRLVLAALMLGGSWLLIRRMGVDGVGVAWICSTFLLVLARLPTLVRALRKPTSATASRARHRADGRSATDITSRRTGTSGSGHTPRHRAVA
ncbi:MAG: lipopolysaccharide biosynthesis protein [Streptosporangiaceae bacterium]